MFQDFIERFEILWYCIAISSVSVASQLDCIKNMISSYLSVKGMEYLFL